VEVVSVKVDKKTKRRMRRLAQVNWSETIRMAIEKRAEEEELKERQVDPQELEEAVKIADSIRRPSLGWSSTEEIRKWRERRK